MEEDIDYSEDTSKHTALLVKKRLGLAIEAAEERINYEAAHNPELLRALGVIYKFLKKSGRVCYGGTAMNAILPKKKRFYNPELDLPDYDFFTSNMEKDIETLIKDLTAAGFKDIYHRVGIHEGTKKLLVNFVPIADITYIAPEVYSVFHKRAFVIDGVRYTDPDVLRMMMYLELSRPKGQVSRWEKVYERLEIINETFPPRKRGTRKSVARGQEVLKEVRILLLNFCIDMQRILFTGSLDTFYRGVIHRKNTSFHTDYHTGVIGMITRDARADAAAIQKILGNTKSFLHRAKGEIIPEHIELRYHGVPVALLFQEAACHSYLNFQTPSGQSIPIASLDTLITLYYGISLFTTRAKGLLPKLEGQIPQFIKLAEENRRLKNPPIPAFPLSCRGYQRGFATLMREKFLRIQNEKMKGRQEEEE